MKKWNFSAINFRGCKFSKNFKFTVYYFVDNWLLLSLAVISCGGEGLRLAFCHWYTYQGLLESHSLVTILFAGTSNAQGASQMLLW